ncbi:hypothetical protein PR048_022478 [Dryococelus australis]|uniref:Uncharacterized protein n=1 Tax=Dryococelus australis TaxID=614101 RepID=A0ABQ9H157_9NEOP|nr:hypothetical protein PR048_022478 [Dryococelus australis]
MSEGLSEIWRISPLTSVHATLVCCGHPRTVWKHGCFAVSEMLVRRRSEHNDGEIGSLEELSLAQERLGKIEHLQNWCSGLRILLLQDNLIPAIENVGRLKRLEYLNLALNCVERVDGLQGCESLCKLDLTLNFVGELSSVATLRHNLALRCLSVPSLHTASQFRIVDVITTTILEGYVVTPTWKAVTLIY